MLPVPAMANSADGFRAYTVPRRQLWICGVGRRPDGQYIGLCEFGHAMGGTAQAMLSALCNLIGRVVRIGTEKKMLRINAGSVIAAVADMEIVRNFAAENFKRHAMRALRFFADHDLPIALGFTGSPVPTFGIGVGFCFGDQSLFERRFRPSRHEGNLA